MSGALNGMFGAIFYCMRTERSLDNNLAKMHKGSYSRGKAKTEMSSGAEKQPIHLQSHELGATQQSGYDSLCTSSHSLTLVELLVVISIISVLMALMWPVLARVRRQARTTLGINNLRQIVSGVNLFAFDNQERYPQSVATVGPGDGWNWSSPRKIAALDFTTLSPHRSISEFLRSYIEDGRIMFCPNAPKKYTYIQEAWDAGDEWSHPNSGLEKDAVIGTYCFYWNYVGYMVGRDKPLLRGPQGPAAGGRKQSKLVVSCYFGFDFYRSPDAYGTCEWFAGADTTPEFTETSAYWSRPESDEVDLDTINIKLHAGYTAGHVESYTPSQVIKMMVILDRATNELYEHHGPGKYYLPKNSMP